MRTSTGAAGGIADVMVGRRQELESLVAWLDEARDGAGRLVLSAGEPGIGKTRLGQELAGIALARGTVVAWGRCVETEGTPPFWPWRQVLRSFGTDPGTVLAGAADSPEDRFRLVDDMSRGVLDAVGVNGLVVIVDDIHSADEPSLLVLRHLAGQVDGARLLVYAAYRPLPPGATLPGVLPDLLRSPATRRLELRGFTVDEVGEQLSKLTADGAATDPAAVLDVTGGNPLFVREVARAVAEGTWRSDRPPRTVLEVVQGRLDHASGACRRFVQAAAVVGRDFPLALVAATLDEPVASCLPLADEAIAHGLVDQVGGVGAYRFVHALTRDAVQASLTTAARVELHRAAARATEAHFAANPSDHVAEIARHWAELAPYGEAATARSWAIRAGDEAVRRLAYEEGVRFYRAALVPNTPALSDAERCRLCVALGRAAYLAGDLRTCVDATMAAADAARSAHDAELLAEAALVLEALPDPQVNAVTEQLCDEALASLPPTEDPALHARLLAQRSHLAFYDGEHDRVDTLSATAVGLARRSGDARAIVDALHARKEACPGPTGRAERMLLATEMLTLAERTHDARTAMWGRLWRIDALIEDGRLRAAAEEVPALQLAVGQVGGPVSAWHLGRVSACLAQAQGHYADAAALGRRAFERMRPVEPIPAGGVFFALQCALAAHVGISDEAVAMTVRPFEPPPRFRTMARITNAFLLLRAGRPEAAAASYQLAGPVETWSLAAFFVVPGYVYATLVSAELGRHDDLAVIVERLRPFQAEHASGEAVAYLGPVELTLGRGTAALGRIDEAVEHLEAADDLADRAGAPGFVAEARYHLATVLLARNGPGDHDRALSLAHDADRLARGLGMAAYIGRTAALVRKLDGGPSTVLSPREVEVATLVAEGLTNRQIAERLFISQRTAENHVKHILTKLGFTTRSQIAAWSARGANE